MCLNSITWSTDKPTNKEYWCWKDFYVDSLGNLRSLYRDRPIFERGVWQLDACPGHIVEGRIRYPRGFHAYKHPHDHLYERESTKRQFPQLQVALRKVHTIGIQEGREVLVAKEIYIPLEEDSPCA